jgi:hypothetical protein
MAPAATRRFHAVSLNRQRPNNFKIEWNDFAIINSLTMPLNRVFATCWHSRRDPEIRKVAGPNKFVLRTRKVHCNG